MYDPWPLPKQLAEIDLIIELDQQNWRMIRLMAKNICEVCGNTISMMVRKGSGICSEDCEDARDGKKEHPFVMPPHQKMGFTRPADELDGIIMDGTSGEGVDPGSIR